MSPLFRKAFFLGAILAVAFPLVAGAQPKPTTKPAAPAKAAPAKAAPAKAAPAAATAKDAGAPTTASDAGVVTASTDGGAGTAATVTQPVATEFGDAGITTPAAQQRKMFPPPPPPTQQQIAALGQLKEEVDAFEKGARDYRDTVTNIIKLHYESKKREVLSGLDREIAIEKAELKKARETAIKRLEEFIATYSGPRSQPEATPDAMYRLAALYEERARSEDATQPLEVGLMDAIALYKRVINEYPKYKELAGIYYFLGHAYNDSGRIPEAQQVWRSLVCHNVYPYPTGPDPKDPKKDLVKPMVQDHEEAYWNTWRRQHDDPKKVAKSNPDTSYQEVYAETCQYIPQPNVLAGEDPKYVAEIWWQIGNWEFDQLDFPSGVTKDYPGPVWGYNRAASAYVRAMKYKKPPLYGVSLYKYAWTLFKQQRYEAATQQFVALLNYTDEQQKLTGDTGADFRGEAYTYIAGSLTNVDFKGPQEWEPFIQRPDILDTQKTVEDGEKKLHIAVDRVKDPKIVPQDKAWTIEVYRGLALEFRSLNQFNNAVEVYETMLAKWPWDPTAPDTQNAIAETYDQLNITKRPGTPEHDATAQKALEARTKLANYIGNTEWVDKNKDNPGAIQNAERLVRGGLRQAAAQHTNNGKAALVSAGETGEVGRQLELLSRAATEYKLAGTGWYGYLKQDENAPDAYESRYWLADARHQYVRIQVKLHEVVPKTYPEPSRKDIDDALAAAVDVRDSNEDDKFLENSAFFVVDVSDVDRDLAYARPGGVPRREEVKFDSEDQATRKPVREQLPAVVQQSVNARDEYVRIVPPNLDSQHHGIEYQYYAAETYFLYGQFDVARARFEPMWKDHCGKDEYGYRAWEKLITMSNLERDATRSTQLAEAEKAHSCAVTAEQTGKAGSIVMPTLQEAAYVNARKKFEEACGAPIGQICKNPDAPEKKPKWKEAAELYEAALQAAPARDEAPEAAMNAAYAWKQIGDYNKAIADYNKFISEYGSNERLNALQKGDPKTKTAPDPKKYADRVKYLGDAYDALATTYYSFFNYQRAAETNEKIAQNDRFDEKKRRDASKNAMILYANLGQRDKMMEEYRTLSKLHPDAGDKANGDYLVADYDYKQWNSSGADTGSNRQTRYGAIAALQGYYQANRANANAGKFLVEAAYQTAKMMKVGNDPAYRTWLRNTVTAWEAYNKGGAKDKDGKSEAQLPPYVDYAAEADFTLLDEEITAKFDNPDRHKYPGSQPGKPPSVDPDVLDEYKVDAKTNKPIMGADGKPVVAKKGKYTINAEEAVKWDGQLYTMAAKYPGSLEWPEAMIARGGEIFDTLRTGLYNVVKIQLFNPQQQKVIDQMHNSGRQDLDDAANNLEDAKRDFWRTRKQQELDGADENMVRRYAQAVALSRKYNVKNPHVSKAVARLAYYTDIIGDANMSKFVTNTADPVDKNKKLTYQSNQYVTTRPGLTSLPAANGQSEPLPAAP